MATLKSMKGIAIQATLSVPISQKIWLFSDSLESAEMLKKKVLMPGLRAPRAGSFQSSEESVRLAISLL